MYSIQLYSRVSYVLILETRFSRFKFLEGSHHASGVEQSAWGLAYVALSRVSRREDIQIVNCDGAASFRADPNASKFDITFQS